MKSLREFAFRHVGPVLTALLLAAVSIVPVARLLVDTRPEMWYWSYLVYPDRTAQQALLLATCAVVPAALLGGYLGGRVRARRPLAGVYVALAVSWPVGITMLPLAATVLGIPMQDVVVCIDTCTPQLESGEPLSGLQAYAYATLTGLYTLMPAGVAIVFGAIATAIARKRLRTLATVFVVLAYGSLHVFSLLQWQARIPFACLGVGVIAWTMWLNARDRHLLASRTAPLPTDTVHQPPAAAPATGRL